MKKQTHKTSGGPIGWPGLSSLAEGLESQPLISQALSKESSGCEKLTQQLHLGTAVFHQNIPEFYFLMNLWFCEVLHIKSLI